MIGHGFKPDFLRKAGIPISCSNEGRTAGIDIEPGSEALSSEEEDSDASELVPKSSAALPSDKSSAVPAPEATQANKSVLPEEIVEQFSKLDVGNQETMTICQFVMRDYAAYKDDKYRDLVCV